MEKIKRENIHHLKFKELSFTYEGQSAILEQVSFDFPMNKVVLLQGPTGGGKNTLLKIMAGLAAPSLGQFLINDIPVQNFSYSEFDRYRLSIGYAFDTGGLINNMTLYENFKIGLDFHTNYTEAEKKERIVSLLSIMNLDEVKHLRPASVSSGAKKAAILLRAFLMEPEMLILNNPTLGLNNEHLLPLVNLIRDYQEKKNLKHIFVSSDDTNFVNHFEYQNIKVVNRQILLEEKTPFKKAG